MANQQKLSVKFECNNFSNPIIGFFGIVYKGTYVKAGEKKQIKVAVKSMRSTGRIM